MEPFTVNRSINIRIKELEPYFIEYHEFLDVFNNDLRNYPIINVDDENLELYDCISLTIYYNILSFTFENKDLNKLFRYDVVTDEFKNRAMNFLLNPYIKYMFIYDMYNQYYLYIIVNKRCIPITEFLDLVKHFAFKQYEY